MELPNFSIRLWLVITTMIAGIVLGFIQGWMGGGLGKVRSRRRRHLKKLLVEILCILNVGVFWVDIVGIYYSWVKIDGANISLGLRILVFVLANIFGFYGGVLLFALTYGIGEFSCNLRRRLYFSFRRVDEEVLEKVTDTLKLVRPQTSQPEVREIIEKVFRTGLVPLIGFPKRVWFSYRRLSDVL